MIMTALRPIFCQKCGISCLMRSLFIIAIENKFQVKLTYRFIIRYQKSYFHGCQIDCENYQIKSAISEIQLSSNLFHKNYDK